MRTIYYIMIVVALIALIATIVLPFFSPVIFADIWQMLLGVTLGIPLIILACIGIEKQGILAGKEQESNCVSNENAQEELSNDEKNDVNDDNKEANTQKSQQAEPETETNEEITLPIEDCLEKKWSKAMYQRYNTKWDELFDNIQIPLTPEKNGEISWLLWEIASQTVNFIKESNSDLNKVGYNTEAVRMIIDNLPEDEIELKKFYNDRSTVQVRVIAIYEWLQKQGVKVDTTAFGYQLKVENEI